MIWNDTQPCYGMIHSFVKLMRRKSIKDFRTPSKIVISCFAINVETIELKRVLSTFLNEIQYENKN